MSTSDDQANGETEQARAPAWPRITARPIDDRDLAGGTGTDSTTAADSPVLHRSRDWHAIAMIVLATLVLVWTFLPQRNLPDPAGARVAVGQFSPPLRCSDPITGEPLLGLVPRGWFVWIVLAPDIDPDGERLLSELDRAEPVWNTMADLDQWRRVIVSADARTARNLQSRVFEPELTPAAVGLRRNPGADVWSGAERVRHLLVEPTGRILLIEPAESEYPGSLDKIRNDLRRRLRAWEGDFDDLPRFS